MLSAIIVAGGSSRRMGFDKLFALLGEEPIVAHSLAAFEGAPSVDEIILVGRTESLTELEALVGRRNFRKVKAIVAGGRRRQDSVARGLERLASTTDFVAVHDGARPLVRPGMIERIYGAARTHGGAASGVAVIDTLKRVDDNQLVVGRVDRVQLFAVETPQIFRRELLEKAYQTIAETAVEVTDEISAVERVGGQVMIVPNEEKNFKITVPADLPLAEFILRTRV
jgi:2-C-methyl-D-erythritol 4-phosphate cytidylyltransferase